jgi:hypothetical protein
MGLDIDYCSLAGYVGPDDSDDDQPDDERTIYINPDFPDRADGLQAGVYRSDKWDGFRAGSYSGYNLWRERLCLMAQGSAISTEGKPFHELIWFSDCEGTIGPITARKLAGDFIIFRDVARQYAEAIPQGDCWLERYEKWATAFAAAARGGVVRFH